MKSTSVTAIIASNTFIKLLFNVIPKIKKKTGPIASCRNNPVKSPFSSDFTFCPQCNYFPRPPKACT